MRSVYQRSGIDLTVAAGRPPQRPDSGDRGNNWSEAELHDLMEARFDLYANTLQWNTYGLIVPRFGDRNYNSGYYGTMFDWGGWQVGRHVLQAGLRTGRGGYEGAGGRARSTTPRTRRTACSSKTFIHEVGHSFNLPHAWQRGTNADSGSESYKNYAWGYTGGGGGETAFWTNYRWEFDDVELIWMRHGDAET